MRLKYESRGTDQKSADGGPHQAVFGVTAPHALTERVSTAKIRPTVAANLRQRWRLVS
jgi:hypothetical protein